MIPAEVTPQSVYDTLLDAATRNVSLHLHAAQVCMLAQLVQEILARVQALEGVGPPPAGVSEVTPLDVRDALEAAAKLDAKSPPPPIVEA